MARVIATPTVKYSYGIMCCRYNKKVQQLEVLTIHKRPSFAYVEFVMGKYERSRDASILTLFNKMTSEEKLDILSLDFGKIWYRIYLYDPEFNRRMEDAGKQVSTAPDINAGDRHKYYLTHKNRFERNFLADKGRRLRTLLNLSHSSETIWEFPKGRKAFSEERDLNCAIREFEEETQLTPEHYRILPETPITTVVQDAHKRFISTYFVALLQPKYEPRFPSDRLGYYRKSVNIKLNYNNPHQVSEVLSLQWVNLQKLSVLDPSMRLHDLAQKVFNRLRKKYKVSRLY